VSGRFHKLRLAETPPHRAEFRFSFLPCRPLPARGARSAGQRAAGRVRHAATDAERKLWYRLRARSLPGFKFVRQEPIGPYVADFICRERRLIVEVDGGQHAESQRDLVRDRWLAEHGYRVLRFWNNDVMGNIEGVLETIAAALKAT
jgi:very-short-patch-repair endonuclease